ncbi:MAG: hypothetical protein ACTIDN_11140 [Acetobacter sp.]|uniref:hypothetical protein n=1 Tax=Acetobacter sp. TaxID=440 RepID=UPI003F8FB309
MSRLRKAWRVRSPWQETCQGEIIFSSTASKARYQGFLSASEHDDDLKIIDMSVKRARPDDVRLPFRFVGIECGKAAETPTSGETCLIQPLLDPSILMGKLKAIKLITH